MRRVLWSLVVIFAFHIRAGACFDKVVIWGHKLHSHTHSYVHNGFYRAFQHLGYPTYWFDGNDDVTNVDFSNALFITEGQVDSKIPLREDSTYILHNAYDPKYSALRDRGHCINLQVYTDDVLRWSHMTKVDNCIYYDLPGQCLYMPWATDLLPHEIDVVKATLKTECKTQEVNWVGTIGGGEFGNEAQLAPFVSACKENNISFKQIHGASLEDNKRLIQKSYLAPTIVGAWQQKQGYIPCRIFKNISYGHMGVTNSPRIYELFNKKIVFNTDTQQLFYDAQKRIASMDQKELFELMDFVKEKHTYINRIQTLLSFLNLVERVVLMNQTLDRYKDYLEKGNFDGQDFSCYIKQPKSRYHTFKQAFEHFIQTKGHTIVELGTSRSFVHGGLVGCNSDDIKYWTPDAPQNWDWGAGFFTRVAVQSLGHTGAIMHTIDICSSHIERCKIITAPFKGFISYHVCSSLDFLQHCSFEKGIDLLYLDTGDMTPIEPTAQLQLEEARIICQRNLISDDGIIIIDDVRNPTPKKFGETSDLGKAKYSIAYLLAHGFEIIADEYQVILRKRKNQ